MRKLRKAIKTFSFMVPIWWCACSSYGHDHLLYGPEKHYEYLHKEHEELYEPGSCSPKQHLPTKYHHDKNPLQGSRYSGTKIRESDLYMTEAPSEYESHWGQNFAQDIRRDFKVYFENDNLILFGDFFIVAGVLANTGLDRAFQQHWQDDIRGHGGFSDHIFEGPKAIGGLSYYYAPIYLLSMGIGHLRDHSEFGNVLYHWGYRSVRTFIVGGLQQVILTNALGSGRPNRHEDSKWQPFRYNTAVSGHAFYGAIPFLTAALMTDPLLPKAALYALSVLPGLSRINSNCHYLSEVLLGWGIAFLTSRSVYKSDMERDPNWRIHVFPRADGAMLSVHTKF